MEDFVERMERMAEAIPKYAKAKAERVYIEQFRKSKKALLMGECDAKTAVAKEQYAYSHPEYRQLLDGLRDAVEYEEKCRWSLERFKMELEHWRTLQANDRFLKDRV
jgi:hypothetical protein